MAVLGSGVWTNLHGRGNINERKRGRPDPYYHTRGRAETMNPMRGVEELLSPGRPRRRMGRWNIPFKKPKHHQWLLKRKLANLHNESNYKEYEAAFRHCVGKYKFIYLFKYNDSSSFGFQIFQQVLWPSSRFFLDCCDPTAKAVLGTSSELSKLVSSSDDIGFCFSHLPKWKLVREFSNYEEFYLPHGACYDRITVIFRTGYLMAGNAQVIYKNLEKLQLEKHVELHPLEDGMEIPKGITQEGVVNVLKNIVSREANLKQSNYLGHHKEFLKRNMTFSFTPTLLGCWNIDAAKLEIYNDTSCMSADPRRPRN